MNNSNDNITTFNDMYKSISSSAGNLTPLLTNKKIQIQKYKYFVLLCLLVSAVRSLVQLIEHWTSIPKIEGSIPTVVRHFLQLARCGYKLTVTAQTSFSRDYITLRYIKITIKPLHFLVTFLAAF